MSNYATEDYREATLMRTFGQHNLDFPNFGHLYWKLRVTSLTSDEINDLLDTISLINSTFYVFLEPTFFIEFDYYIHADLLPEIRATLDAYAHGSVIETWIFCDF